MQTIYGSMKNIDPEQRAAYLESSQQSIKGQLDKYEFRLARGIPLTPEQQSRYNSLKSAFNDIQSYINNPQPYEDYFANIESNMATGEAYKAELERRRTYMPVPVFNRPPPIAQT
jgi:hypothetical protein